MTCELVAAAGVAFNDSYSLAQSEATPDTAAELAAKAAALAQRIVLTGRTSDTTHEFDHALHYLRALSAWIASQELPLEVFFCLEKHLRELGGNALESFQRSCTTNFSGQINMVREAVRYLQRPPTEMKISELVQSTGVVAGFMHAFNDIAERCAYLGSKGFENWTRLIDLTNGSPSV